MLDFGISERRSLAKVVFLPNLFRGHFMIGPEFFLKSAQCVKIKFLPIYDQCSFPWIRIGPANPMPIPKLYVDGG